MMDGLRDRILNGWDRFVALSLWWKVLIVFALVVVIATCSSSAEARWEPPGDEEVVQLTSEQFTELVQTLTQLQDQQQAQDQKQSNTNDAAAYGGDPKAQSNPRIDQKIIYPVHAPGIAVRPGNNTAPYLKCIGLGGSGSNGSNAGAATGAYCWIVRPIWWEEQAKKLVSLGLTEQAAVAYCMDSLQWKPFGSKDDCLAVHTQRFIEMELDAEPEVSKAGKELMDRQEAEIEELRGVITEQSARIDELASRPPETIYETIVTEDEDEELLALREAFEDLKLAEERL